MSFKMVTTTVLACFLSLTAQAQNPCFMDDFQVDLIAGYNVTGAQKKILQSDSSTAFTKGLSEDEILERILTRIRIYPTSKNPVSDQELALEIYRVSKAFGLDPFLMTAKIEVESDFKVGANNRNGTGLTQMTSIAVEEMTYQYEKPDVGAIFKNLSSKFYRDQDDLSKWMSWAKSRAKSYSDKKQVLARDYRYSLSAGASILKFYLARSQGNYAKAITAYNGGGTAGYTNHVMGLKQEINQTCQLSDELVSVMRVACEMTGSEEECHSISHEILGTFPKAIAI